MAVATVTAKVTRVTVLNLPKGISWGVHTSAANTYTGFFFYGFECFVFDKSVTERKSVGLSSSFVCLLVIIFVSLVLRHNYDFLVGCLSHNFVRFLFVWLAGCCCLFVCLFFLLHLFLLEPYRCLSISQNEWGRLPRTRFGITGIYRGFQCVKE